MLQINPQSVKKKNTYINAVDAIDTRRSLLK